MGEWNTSPILSKGETTMSDTVDVQLDEKIKVTTKEPSRYKVVFLNDDATPMQFVMEVLVHIFRHNSDSAEEVTMTIHNEGAGVVGIYSHELAEQKARETVAISEEHNFPLRVKLEKE